MDIKSLARGIVVKKLYPIMDDLLPQMVALKIKLIACVLVGDWQFYCPFLGYASSDGSRSLEFALRNLDDGGEFSAAFGKTLAVLTQDSSKRLSTLIDRVRELPLGKLRSSLLMKRDALFTVDELAEQRAWHQIKKEVAAQKLLPKGVSLHSEVFMFDNGLAFLPQKAKEHIKGKDFIDAGSYVGDSAIVFMKYSPRKVYSFDISSRVAPLYQETMRRNRIPDGKHELIIKALARNGGGKLDFSDADGGQSSIDLGGAESVDATTLDDFVAERKAVDIGFIKADLEGFGLEFCYGAASCLKKFRPVLALAIYHNADEFFGIPQFLSSLDLNYVFTVRKLCTEDILCDLTLIAYPKELETASNEHLDHRFHGMV